VFPFYNNGEPFVFSGAIAGRTNCESGPCQIANCVQNGDWGGDCTLGVGFSQPTTQAEFTLSKNGLDYYDVEIINGISLPTTMAPDTFPNDPNNPYFCNAAGSRAGNNLGSCSWSFSPPTDEYNWVTQGGATCSSSSDCGGQTCGLAIDFPGKPSGQQMTCGSLIGYWSANQICGMQSNYQGSINCDQALGGGLAGLTLTNLLGCSGGPINSCYQNGADPNTCCGCVDWNTLGLPVPAPPATQACVAQDQTWIQDVLPKLQWMKEGCPTAYTYPYDDMSSTMTCTNNNGGINTMSYTITFCT